MSFMVEFTHKGWMGFCPVWVAEDGCHWARYNLHWLLKLNKSVAQIFLDTTALILQEEVEMSPCWLTKLSEPFIVEFI